MADGDVVRRITISATGEGIGSATDAVNSLGNAFSDSSEKAESFGSAFSELVVGLAGVSAATIGLLAGMRAFVDYAGAQSQALVDIADHAEGASISTREYQETLYAAMSKGVSDKDFTSGLEKITDDLAKASQGTTELTKLFEANGIAIKNQNGQLISTKEALGDMPFLNPKRS
jgi:hypothetical protein